MVERILNPCHLTSRNSVSTLRGRNDWDLVASDLAKFDPNDLLDILISVRERGLGPAAFDAEASRRELTRLADWYFWRRKQETIPNAARAKLFAQLATNNDEVSHGLFKVLYEVANGPFKGAPIKSIETSPVTLTRNELNEAMAGLLTLETAARRAATNVRRRGGRPKGTAALPPECIVHLAMLFRSSTGTRPGAGEGPFARFVSAFLNAVGRAIADSAVIDAIKDARAQSLQQPSGWPSSPFK